jgi:protein associated with RNAse G/E
MSYEIVNVVYRKYDGSLHWHHRGLLLGEDEHGVWTGCVAGSSGHKGNGPAVAWPNPFVMLFPRDAWWTAAFNAAPNKHEIYCDISTVPEWRDGEVTMIDLDLDVIRTRRDVLKGRTRRIFLDDEDEFEEHRIRYAYPPDVVQNARDSAAWLMKAVTAGTPPFGATPHWLSLVT